MARRFKVKPIKTKSKKALGRVKDKLPGSNDDEDASAPRITNDTVAEHREEVLSGGRKFLYPLQHSKHRVVIISAMLIVILLLSVLIYSYIMLYRWQSTSNFAYRVTQILPTPVARIDGKFVAYEDYLFELNSAIYYYRNHAQEGVDIDSEEGQKIVSEAKTQAMEKAKMDVLAAKIASDNGISITNDEIDEQIEKIQTQGGIGQSDGVLSDVLADFYNWDVNDLRKVVQRQLIRQKITPLIDSATVDRAQEIMTKVNDGGDFEKLAKESSDDKLTKDNKGVIGLITTNNTDLPSEFIDAAFALEEGQASTELVQSPFGLHIIRVNKVEGEEREVAHILFRFINIENYLKDQINQVDNSDYISI